MRTAALLVLTSVVTGVLTQYVTRQQVTTEFYERDKTHCPHMIIDPTSKG